MERIIKTTQYTEERELRFATRFIGEQGCEITEASLAKPSRWHGKAIIRLTAERAT